MSALRRDRGSRCATAFRTHPRRLPAQEEPQPRAPRACRTSRASERIAFPCWLPAPARRGPRAPLRPAPSAVPSAAAAGVSARCPPYPPPTGRAQRAARCGLARPGCSRKWPAGLGRASWAGGGRHRGQASRGQSQLPGTGGKEVEPPSTSSGPRHPLLLHQPAPAPSAPKSSVSH